MAIYDRPTHSLMGDFAKEKLSPGQVFSKADAVAWFQQNYPRIKAATIKMHVDGMSVNSTIRKHAPNVRPGLDWDLFIKLPNGAFRLWDPKSDPQPVYQADLLASNPSSPSASSPEDDDSDLQMGSDTFAYEHHLRDYLARNLGLIEPGLRLYEDEGFSGVEFPAGGRFIDVLALDRNGDFVVVELKVSRGYDRTIGQLLRYMTWIEKNLAEGKKVRGVIVAGDISEDLRLAASRISDIRLLEYEIALTLKPVFT